MKNDQVQLKSLNIPLMYAITVAGGMLFFLPVLALYFQSKLYTATNVALVFSIEAVCLVLFEVPTGAVADLFGRKRTILLSRLADLSAVVLLYFAKTMPMFAGYALLNALARSLSSGTESALIYDTLKEEGREQQYKKIIGIHYALWPLGASAGSIIGGYLVKDSLQLPVLWTFLPVGLTFIGCLFLKEPRYQRKEHRNIFRHMKDAFRTISGNKQLIVLISASLVMMSLGETIHYLSPLFFKFKLIPIQYFGYISALTYGLSSLGHYLSNSFVKWMGDRVSLIVITLLSPILTLAATFAGSWGTVVLFTLPSICFGLKNPVIDHLLNKEISSGQRATIISANSFASQLGIAATAPLFGFIAQTFNINRAVQASSLVLLAVPLLLLLLQDQE
ncbi:MFS transporter [candidate division TA06 bacterium]|uniref:MFS transporter n=1 Tax=candidate division TA06 bacterium TaxID=2250710 RepID=A0A933I9F3_UNCT6|nr:MFS transporter [candidate division TA06 bacterium]